MDLFDYKPALMGKRGEQLPDSIRKGQRLTGMTATQDRLPVAPTIYKFAQHGKSGAWVSELLPHTASMVDDLCFIKTVNTDAINHDPAVTFFQTGAPIAGRPSIGSWLAYGLGSESKDLPAFVVLITQGGNRGQPLYDRLWGSGFLPTKYQGVKFRSSGDPVLFPNRPRRLHATIARVYLDALARLNQGSLKISATRKFPRGSHSTKWLSACKLPCRTSRISPRSRSTFQALRADARKPGTFAANCLLARRLAERGVRFIQLFHRDWDHHNALPKGSAQAMQSHGSGRRGVGAGLEGSRDAGRHAGGLGRGIRSHSLLPG